MEPVRIRNDVYIIGAGFSAGLGYPLTKNLLYEVWNRLKVSKKEKLRKVIKFHYPYFNEDQSSTFPNIEQLLTLMKVNEDLFHASRIIEGNFRLKDLREIRESLLYEISNWFHEIYNNLSEKKWLNYFIENLKSSNVGIISFNWDLILDHKLFTIENLAHGYGLCGKLSKETNNPILLKPHGSLNWYDERQVTKITNTKKFTIFNDKTHNVEAFIYPRGIRSKHGRKYTPLIIPPMYLKDFSRPIFQRLWQYSTELLSTAKNIYILGYSLPKDDLQAQFILRCGFHNQKEGRVKANRDRYPATGIANIYIINPDRMIKKRYQDVVGPDIKIKYINKTVEDWVLGGM